MADEIDWLDLPGRWTYGVDRGGRIFFINDEEKSTSWLHPGTGSPIQSGHSAGPGKESPAPTFAVDEELEVVMETLGPRPTLTFLLLVDSVS